jgi:hypothetical protein
MDNSLGSGTAANKSSGLDCPENHAFAQATSSAVRNTTSE